MTGQIRIGTSVLIVPYRRPLLIARMAANLQDLSGGHLVLGVGAGRAAQEFGALGVPFGQRGQLTDDYLRPSARPGRMTPTTGAGGYPSGSAATNMAPAERAAATVYTSGEHCPMCSAAHGWAGLGRIVYASSSEQMVAWLAELGVGPAPVRPLAITEVVPGLAVAGPVPGLAEQVRDLHRRFRSG